MAWTLAGGTAIDPGHAREIFAKVRAFQPNSQLASMDRIRSWPAALRFELEGIGRSVSGRSCEAGEGR